MINNLESAITTSNGVILSSVVSPIHGLDVRLYADGLLVNHDVEHAKSLFGSTDQDNWRIAPGSGSQTNGSFKDVVLPALLAIFNKPYTFDCTELKSDEIIYTLKVGASTYTSNWSSDPSVKFHSIAFRTTQGSWSPGWQYLLTGTEQVSGKLYLLALLLSQPEP
ncbi:MAG: hypothetical protein WCA79_15620 [Anaerolineales bacterium]